MTAENIVKLDVGGTIFKTSKSTLTKFDGFFKTMLETGIPIAKDESGAIFVDRSARHFDRILNFMRDGRLNFPESSEDVKDIQDEARYYLLGGLVQLCERELRDRAEKSLPAKSDFKILESKKEYFEVIVNAVKPTLVIYCPIVKGAVSLPNNFDFKQFLLQHENTMDIYFRPYERIPTETDRYPRSWSWSLHWNKKHQNDGSQNQNEGVWLANGLRISIDQFFRENRLA